MIYLSRWMLKVMLEYPTWLMCFDIIFTMFWIILFVRGLIEIQRGE